MEIVKDWCAGVKGKFRNGEVAHHMVKQLFRGTQAELRSALLAGECAYPLGSEAGNQKAMHRLLTRAAPIRSAPSRSGNSSRDAEHSKT